MTIVVGLFVIAVLSLVGYVLSEKPKVVRICEIIFAAAVLGICLGAGTGSLHIGTR